MLDELVRYLAALQAEQKAESHAGSANIALRRIELEIKNVKDALASLTQIRNGIIAPYTARIAEIEIEMDNIKAQIIDEWTGEKKTMVFDAGTLKFTTRGSLEVNNSGGLLSHLISSGLPISTVAEDYITGFNKTNVKKYMSVIELPIDVAEIEYKTTVKLEARGIESSANNREATQPCT